MEDCKFTTSLNREISNLKELVFSRIDSIEKAIELSHSNYVRVPTDIQKEVGSAREYLLALLKGEHDLKEIKFEKVEQRFVLNEQARVEQKKDTERAVEAALKSQEMAFVKQNESFLLSINKSEDSTTKQIDALSKNINDLKERLTRLEGQGSGRKDLWGWIIGAIAVLLSAMNYFLNHKT